MKEKRRRTNTYILKIKCNAEEVVIHTSLFRAGKILFIGSTVESQSSCVKTKLDVQT